jgi:hypothetical protein
LRGVLLPPATRDYVVELQSLTAPTSRAAPLVSSPHLVTDSFRDGLSPVWADRGRARSAEKCPRPDHDNGREHREDGKESDGGDEPPPPRVVTAFIDKEGHGGNHAKREGDLESADLLGLG